MSDTENASPAGIHRKDGAETVVCRLADGSEIETTLSACQNTPGATVVSKLAAVASELPAQSESVICRLADGSEIETTLSACQGTPGAKVVGRLG